MLRVVVGALFLLSACDLYFAHNAPTGSVGDGAIDADQGGSPDTDGTCGGKVVCINDRHCEPQCAPAGTNGCTYTCHDTCVPDHGCATVSCGPGRTCVETCTRECQGFPDFCGQMCVPNDQLTVCETLTTEAACLARSDCIAIRHGHGCTCDPALCTCLDEAGGFARCEAAVGT